MPASLRLVHINIEGSKHLDLVIPFIQQRKPDVVCVQEIREADIPQFEEKLGMHSFFSPMLLRPDGARQGNAVFSRTPHVRSRAQQYGGQTTGELLTFDNRDKQHIHDSAQFMLLVCDIEKDGALFHIATTHFPVTDHGEATDFQREDMKTLLGILEKEGEFVLTGDFNAPRGGEVFGTLAAHYKDNVPPHYTTSIDGNIHRAGQLPWMVDGLFSTPGYTLSDVEMKSGVSDHCALVATVIKTS